MTGILNNAQEAAGPVAEVRGLLKLSPRDSQAFIEAQLYPPAPNDRLREMAARYRQIMGI